MSIWKKEEFSKSKILLIVEQDIQYEGAHTSCVFCYMPKIILKNCKSSPNCSLQTDISTHVHSVLFQLIHRTGDIFDTC